MMQRLNDSLQIPFVLVVKLCAEALWRLRSCSEPAPLMTTAPTCRLRHQPAIASRCRICHLS